MSIEAFLARQERLDDLRFITCGSVDDGKSTLIGRLLWDARQVLDDQMAALHSDSRRHGTQGDDLDMALLLDGLEAEREQGITIDVAYRYFATDRRRFIIADTPGHEQYTRNMVTAASTAQLAVILVDARKGLLTQTRRHAFIASLLGVRHVVLAVNKMDLVGYDEQVFLAIQDAFRALATTLAFETVTPIPMSALRGDQVTVRSARMPWYQGPALMDFLNGVDVVEKATTRFAFPVQWVCRPNADFRGFAGTVAQGSLRVGEEIRVTRSGQTARVSALVAMGEAPALLQAGQAAMLTLDREIDVSRGDVLGRSTEPLESSDQFEAHLIWMSEEAGLVGRRYDIKLAGQWASASMTSIKHVIDMDTMAKVAGRQLSLNAICLCTLSTSKVLAFEAFTDSRALGAFILVDRLTHATVAAGLIRRSLRRADNLHRQAVSIDATRREQLNGHKGKAIWFTGLSGSGKSTIANALEVALHERGVHTYLLDADNVRQGLNRDLGFTEADRVENIRRIAEVTRLMVDAGLVVLVAFISPFVREREMARELLGRDRFVEVYVDTPLAVCEQRDVKGLYRKARDGRLPNLSGIGSPYEAPLQPDFVASTVADGVPAIVAKLMDLAIER
ncbi:MAG: sulfate adenylyltransferase subunit CysN [Lautropia sp.]